MIEIWSYKGGNPRGEKNQGRPHLYGQGDKKQTPQREIEVPQKGKPGDRKK